MSEKLEQVKAAIAAKFVHAIDFRAPYAKVMLEAAAHAAIEAMREPTEAMAVAAKNCDNGDDHNVGRFAVVDIWKTMIDEALR